MRNALERLLLNDVDVVGSIMKPESLQKIGEFLQQPDIANLTAKQCASLAFEMGEPADSVRKLTGILLEKKRNKRVVVLATQTGYCLLVDTESLFPSCPSSLIVQQQLIASDTNGMYFVYCEKDSQYIISCLLAVNAVRKQFFMEWLQRAMVGQDLQTCADKLDMGLQTLKDLLTRMLSDALHSLFLGNFTVVIQEHPNDTDMLDKSYPSAIFRRFNTATLL